MEANPALYDTKNDSQLVETDEEILLAILPSNIWAYTFQKLEKKHTSTLESISYSSPYFRNLILSKRVLFLFPQVFKLIGPEFANLKNTKIVGSDIIRSRTVCQQWNKTVDQFIIDGTLEPDFFKFEPPQSSDHALATARYKYFGEVLPTNLPQFLAHFQQTHLPQSSRNPFVGKVVYIDLTGFTDRTKWASIADQVSTLLRKYGHHIQLLHLTLFKYQPDTATQSQNHSWLLEWLENCPNLTHLKVSETFNLGGEMDPSFGTCPDPVRTMIRRVGLEMINPNMHARLQQANSYLNDLQHQLDVYTASEDEQRNNPDELLRLTEAIEDHLFGLYPVPIPVHQPVVLPFPTIKNLHCLKLCQLSALNFNSLLSANTHVNWLQIDGLSEEKPKYIDYHALKLPKLKKLTIKLCSPAEVRKLKDIHQSWLSLTNLHFQCCTSRLCCLSPMFTEWIEIFGLISKNWGATLTDLKLELPMAQMGHEKERVVRDTGGKFRLNLPTLKRLKIVLGNRSGERVAKTDFLDLIREKLEQLIIE